MAIIDRRQSAFPQKAVLSAIAVPVPLPGRSSPSSEARTSTRSGSWSRRFARTSSASASGARLIEQKIVQPRDDLATPAEIYENGTDYMPTDRRVLFGHHFAAIAGAGPLVGPVLAMQMGYLPEPSGSCSARCSPAACRTTWY